MKKNKNKKIKIELEKIEPSKSLKIVSILFYISLGLSIVFTLIGAFSRSFAVFLWKFLILPSSSFIYYFAQYFILKIGPVRAGGLLLCFPIILLIDFISRVVGSKKSIPKEKRHKIFNNIQTCLYFFIIFISVYLVVTVFGTQNNPKLDTMFFPEEVDNVYTEDDIWGLNHYLETKVIEYSHLVDRDKDGAIIDRDYVELAHRDFKKASEKYWVLKGNYPKKLYYFDDYDLSHDPSTLGLTTIDVVGLSKEQEAPQLMNTITHELCHTRGIIRENEATLCSVIVGVESDDNLSRYAAYLEAYYRTLDAVYLIDSSRARNSSIQIQKLCTNNHYREICNNGFKLTKLYVRKSDKIVLDTFSLNQYDDLSFLDVFIKKLKPYHPKFYMNAKKIDEADIWNYYNQDVVLEIQFKNSEKIFDEVKDLLDSNKENFYFIGQEYPNMYKGVEMDREEAILYYTSSIPDSNIISYFTSGEKMEEIFDYSRVVRLILEYFDAENIGYLS